MKRTFARWLGPVLIVLLAAPAAWAVVSIDELVRLHQAGLSEQSLLLVVSASDTPDTLTTDQLNQLLDAGIPDTVITELVMKADVVMEDWGPVDLEAELEGRGDYTDTEIQYVYPSWGYGWGSAGWGWGGGPYYCGTPYYGWYRPWYGWGYPYVSPYYAVGIGWGWGGWSFSVGIGWGGGYYGYYNYYPPVRPWYGYHYPGYGQPGTPYYRDISRPDYRAGVDRGVTRGDLGRGRDYRTDNVKTVSSDATLSRVDHRSRTTLTRAKTGDGRYELRGDAGDRTRTKSGLDLRKVTSDPGNRTLDRADQGKGRYALKGDATTPDTRSTARQGREIKTVNSRSAQTERSTRYSRKTGDLALKNRSTLRSKTINSGNRVKSTNTRTETRAQTLDRYVSMKNAQKGVRSSTRSRSTNRATAGSGSSTRRSTRSTAGYTSGSSRSSGSKRVTTRSSGGSTPKVSSGSKSSGTRTPTSVRSGGSRRSSPPSVRSSSPRSSGGSRGVSRSGGSRSSGARGGSRSGGSRSSGGRGGRR